MAGDHPERACTVVLHDDRVSSKDVLGGTRTMHVGEIAYLTAPGARPLCIAPSGLAANPDEISIHVSLAERFGFANRAEGSFRIVEDTHAATASHVELFFRDQYLSRADMWQLMARVDETVIYQGQTLNYLGSATVEVQHIYIGGNEVASALAAHPHTKPIFRSGSARFTILIEISQEMMETWIDGELVYERLIDGFLPDIFRHWDALNAHHVVSVVLFGRLRYTSHEADEDRNVTDFFHVIVSELPSQRSPQILRKLRQAINDHKLPSAVSLAAQTNILEAIHLAAADFADDQTNVRPMNTGTSVIAVTAGAGLFDVDYHLLKQITDLLMGNSIGVDIVALSPKPLHPVPLFQYQHEGASEFALPHWVDISFWRRPEDSSWSRWVLDDSPPVKDVAIPPLTCVLSSEPDPDIAVSYDSAIFQNKSSTPASTTAPTSGPVLDVRSVPNSKSIPKSNTQEKWKTLENHARARMQDGLHSDDTRPLAKPQLQAMSSQSLTPTSRKISLGPKGLAPGRAVASTTLSNAHAQHGRKSSGLVSPLSSDDSSGIAKAIRASLARQPSQQSLATSRISDGDHAQTSRPINIHSAELRHVRSTDPASLVEQRIADTMIGAAMGQADMLSETLKASNGVFMLGSRDIQDECLDILSPWVTLLNPCNPRRDNMRIASQYRKWQHVFPRAVSTSAFKWASMCSPAALPITAESTPSAAKLDARYDKKIRRHVIPPATGLRHENAGILVERLINIRLVNGFQIVAIANSGSEQISQSGDKPILLALGRRYHELQRLSDLEVQIVQYAPKTSAAERELEDRPVLDSYAPKMRMTTGVPVSPDTFHLATAESIDWSALDEHILGLTPLVETNATFKIRLVLLPTEISRAEHGTLTRMRDLSDEEHRIEGIQKLTQMWQRQRYFSDEEKQHQVSLTKSTATSRAMDRDPNPLAIEYQTKDPSAVVNAYGPTLSSRLDEEELSVPLFAESEKHFSGNFDIAKLTKQMQEPLPYGVEVRDRRWLTQTHMKCFRGDEMTTWLLRVFKDLELRDDAVSLGNELMNRGIFTHVRSKHRFRDGHYFYQIASAHRTTDYPDTTGIFSKAPWRSIPATPIAESITSPIVRPLTGDSSSSTKGTPTIDPTDPKALLLSQALQYNVDPGKKSDHQHIVELHYDRIHNPENCYHIRLEWLEASSKLIRESLHRWNALVEPHALRLVQVPLEEASKFREHHPFDQPQPVKLAARPPDKILATPSIEAHLFSPRAKEDRLAYHKSLLRKRDFVLDLEAASSFTTKLPVSYSWGPPTFRYTQFVHRSGLVIAQICADDKADFLLLPNRLASSRMSHLAKNGDIDTADDILKSFKGFCGDVEALVQFYRETERPRHAPSPMAGSVSAADFDVPPIQLPPHLIHRSHPHLQRPLG